MNKLEKVSDKMINKAVDVWCKKLLIPVFDNGDDSAIGAMSHMLSTANIQHDKAATSDIESKIEVFRISLIDRLVKARNSDDYFPCWLDVDYSPCKTLAESADKAGIPHSQFSCKSSVSVWDKHISASFGYGAETTFLYPLSNGKWLKTNLTGGSDLDKIFNHVLDGNELGFEVEN